MRLIKILNIPERRKRIEDYRKEGVTKLEWVCIMDSISCDKCRERDGKIYTIDEFLNLETHEDCRCRSVAVD